MKAAKMWKVTIVTPNHGSWKAIFTFEPNRHQLMAALDGDIKDRAQMLERCDCGHDAVVDCDTERLRQVRDVAVYAGYDFAATQLCQRITVAGVRIGTVQATRERMFTP